MRRKRHAFTLIEVLLALALGLVLMAAVLGFFGDLIRHRTLINERLDQERAAQALIDNLSRELTCAIVGIDRVGPGLVGDEQGISVLARSVAIERAAVGQSRLSDLTQLQFQFDARSKKLLGNRRLIEPASSTNSDDLNLITSKLGWVRFRYLDEGRWRSRYDSAAKQRLPAAVEVAIWYVVPEAMKEINGNSSDGFMEDPLVEESNPDRRRIISIPDAMISLAGEDDFDE